MRGAKAFGVLAFLLALAPAANAADLALYDGETVAAVSYDATGAPPLAKAADMLAHDLAALSGLNPKVVPSFDGLSGPGVIVGLASAPKIAALLKANHLSAAPIAGKWETYGRAVIPAPWDAAQKALLIFGSDVRGAIYGVSDLSREMSVSPWEWWADVTIRKVDHIAVDAATRYAPEPKIKYRAIFLNDEDFGLRPWAAKTYDPKFSDIGPKTYARVYELMWRLKADTLWPAMHKGTIGFDQVPGNPELADAYAIIHATSHAEPMLRNNDREWNVDTMGPFNWLTNRERVAKYWDDAVEEHKQFENIYTVGMRGIGDVGMVGVSSAEQTKNVLTDVIAAQRDMLTKAYGKPAATIPQVFTPYKEVLAAYHSGLKLPDDITLTWPDDNFGYVRHLPDAGERARSGGNGVYYHISYWGGPSSYLWLATMHPALMWEELQKSYAFDARRIWILNVGDIKPGEYLTQLFLDMAFDPGAYPDVASVRAHLKAWAANSFGTEHAEEIAGVMWRYYDLAFARKPEHVSWSAQYPTTPVRQTAYNLLAYGDENARRLAAYEDLALKTQTVMKALPADRRDAFFQLVGYGALSTEAINARVLNMDKAIAYGLQRRASANQSAKAADGAQKRIDALAATYNNDISAGKWKGMMDTAPAKLPVFSAPVYPSWSKTNGKNCVVQAEDGAMYDEGGARPTNLPPFYREVPQSRYFDIFVKGEFKANWTASPSAPWIKVSAASGSFGGKTKAYEQRLNVSIDWASAPENGTGTIAVACDTMEKPQVIGVRIAPRVTAPNVSFIEDDRVVSIYATHADTKTGAWEELDGLGHTGAVLRTKVDMAPVDAAKPAALKTVPTLTYRFATATQDDKAELKVIALPTLPVTFAAGVRVAVSIDGGPVTVLDFATAEMSQEWRENVLTNTAVGRVVNLKLAPGAHELKVIALDPGVILDRFEIAFTGAARAYGPIPETRITQR